MIFIQLVNEYPSRCARFVVCETALEVDRVELAAAVYGLFISKRVDVYGRKGHEKPLFCVFVMRWIRVSEEDNTPSDMKHGDSSSGSSSSSGGGSSSSSSSDGSGCCNQTEVVSLYVRKECGCHTSDYDDVMKVLGRPLSSCSCDQRKDSSTHSKRKAAT